MEFRPCTRPAVRDGYCTRHHPSYFAPSQWDSMTDEERARATDMGYRRGGLKVTGEEDQ